MNTAKATDIGTVDSSAQLYDDAEASIAKSQAFRAQFQGRSVAGLSDQDKKWASEFETLMKDDSDKDWLAEALKY